MGLELLPNSGRLVAMADVAPNPTVRSFQEMCSVVDSGRFCGVLSAEVYAALADEFVWPERRALLYLLHPDECPELIGDLPYLIHPPSRLGRTSRWNEFRDGTLLPMIQERPNDPNLRNFLHQAALILAWRAAIPAEDRFWKPDAPATDPS